MGRSSLPVGKACCGCTGNLGEPNVKFIACIAGRSVVISCECQCHEATLRPGWSKERRRV